MAFPRLALATALALSAVPTLPAAEKLDKESKKWLDDVRAIMLPDEERTFKSLKDKSERDEFRKIFWARRDPDPQTPENEYQERFEKARAEADTRYRAGGRRGSETDCGRVYILLGAPDAVKAPGDAPRLPTIGGPRGPEVWVYRDRPDQKFQGGEIEIAFDESCQLPPSARYGEQLNRLAETRVTQPQLNYRMADGKLVKLADQLPKASPAAAVLKAPRQDFPASTDTSMYLRSPDGATYVAGLVRADGVALPTEEEGGRKVARGVVALQVLDSAGRPVAQVEREVKAEPAADGSFLGSYGVTLRPGDYTLQVAVLDPAGTKATVVSQPLKVPDFNSTEMTLSPLLVLRDIQDAPADPHHPLGSFQLGPMRFLPRFGDVFSPDESVMLLTFLYNPKIDETTGKPSTTASFSILKDGKPVARAQEQNYDTPGAGPSVGPVPLSAYGPGTYVAQVKVRDNVAQKDYTQETPFEIRAGAPAAAR